LSVSQRLSCGIIAVVSDIISIFYSYLINVKNYLFQEENSNLRIFVIQHLSIFFINYIIGNPIRVRRHAKRKKPNIFKDMQLTDDRADLDFLLEPEIGKVVSRSCKTVRDGTNIHPSFDFVFNKEIHGPELSSRLKLDSNMNPHLKTRLLALIKKYL